MSQAVNATAAKSSTSAALDEIAGFGNKQAEQFPLGMFFSLQTFPVYTGVADFLGSILEYPLAAIQMY